MWIVSSFSTMPPGSPMRGRVCRLAMWTPWTMSRDSAGRTRNTSPVLPLSRPLTTTTLSPRLIFSFGILPFHAAGPSLLRRIPAFARTTSRRDYRLSQHLRRQRHDLPEPPRPQLAGHRAKDACPDRFALIGDQHRGVAVETDRTAVCAAYFLGCAHNDGAMHVTFFDPTARDRLLDGDDDHVTDGCGLAFGAAQHLDALHPTGAGIIGDIEVRLHLDHAAPSAGSTVSTPRSDWSRSGKSPSAGTGSATVGAERRPGSAAAGPPSTTQHLRLEIGRLSSIRTTSPTRKLLFSSCAAYFFECVTNFL